jgi:hypothetical protein
MAQGKHPSQTEWAKRQNKQHPAARKYTSEKPPSSNVGFKKEEVNERLPTTPTDDRADSIDRIEATPSPKTAASPHSFSSQLPKLLNNDTENQDSEDEKPLMLSPGGATSPSRPRFVSSLPSPSTEKQHPSKLVAAEALQSLGKTSRNQPVRSATPTGSPTPEHIDGVSNSQTLMMDTSRDSDARGTADARIRASTASSDGRGRQSISELETKGQELEVCYFVQLLYSIMLNLYSVNLKN